MKVKNIIERGPLGTRVKVKLMSLMMGGRENVPEIIPLFWYRPEFFGEAFLAHVQRTLRGDSWWTVGERELMAAWVSQTNGCRFCLASHRAVAELAMKGTPAEGEVLAVLADPAHGQEIRAELRAVLPLLTTLTKTPHTVNAADFAPVRAAGVPEAAIEEAIHIAGIFCIINRIADSLGFAIPDAAAMQKGAQRLLTQGYAS